MQSVPLNHPAFSVQAVSSPGESVIPISPRADREAQEGTSTSDDAFGDGLGDFEASIKINVHLSDLFT